ncbi:hypothetical protein L249_7981 [Ophiocordyceps polyrhachis-furcata BCC 54312]|uniref:Uncharacterized protein n=1 Tax=Ophiocordyceps polyrhachis-furcata BCC 54312 TaxID=1330021 RepID=A0A367LHA2_9HYPO|nr:hypothetical protein L249_7981 [Ophiocordyceps polyrhachis-furcata BCC 54312]
MRQEPSSLLPRSGDEAIFKCKALSRAIVHPYSILSWQNHAPTFVLSEWAAQPLTHATRLGKGGGLAQMHGCCKRRRQCIQCWTPSPMPPARYIRRAPNRSKSSIPLFFLTNFLPLCRSSLPYCRAPR